MHELVVMAPPLDKNAQSASHQVAGLRSCRHLIRSLQVYTMSSFVAQSMVCM